MKKIAIIGGGVAGLSASIYALRANADVTLFEQFGLGGYVANLGTVQNYPSYSNVEGWQLATNIVNHAKSLGLRNVVRQKVISLTKRDDGNFVIVTNKEQYEFSTVIVATGTTRNKLGIEDNFVGRGVSYCATCDGNFFKGQPVAVVGEGNHAVSEALYLADVCSKVYVVAGASRLSANDANVQALTGRNNVTVLYNTVVAQICGEDNVSALTLASDGDTFTLPVSGVFVAVGSKPSTDFIHIDGLNTTNGYINVDADNMSNIQGLYVAGDVSNGKLKQIVTACADGARAGMYACAYARNDN